MQLDFVCDLLIAYQTEPLTGEKFVMIHPYGGSEGPGYGEGDGRVDGPRLHGNLRWVNHPRSRSDGTMQPDAHGIIYTDDRCVIFFTLRGRTVFEQGKGRQLLNVIFEAEAENYRWLNSSLCVLEGLIDGEKLQMRAKVYACRSDMT